MKIKTKKVSYKSVEEDIRPLAASVISLILSRLGKNYAAAGIKLNETFEKENKLEILAAIQDLIEILNQSIEELENTGSLISEVSDLEEVPALEE